MVTDDKIFFYANYDRLGEIQTTKISDEVVMTTGTVTKVKNGLVFFILDNETGERKITETSMNCFRDFGTSVYGVYETEISKHEALQGMIDVLEARISQTKTTINSLVQQFEGL